MGWEGHYMPIHLELPNYIDCCSQVIMRGTIGASTIQPDEQFGISLFYQQEEIEGFEGWRRFLSKKNVDKDDGAILHKFSYLKSRMWWSALLVLKVLHLCTCNSFQDKLGTLTRSKCIGIILGCVLGHALCLWSYSSPVHVVTELWLSPPSFHCHGSCV